MLTGREALEAYLAACNATDPQTRRNLLEQALTEDAPILYPTSEARGWEEVSAEIGRIHQRYPGVSFVLTSGVAEHHGWLRATWRIVGSDGTVLQEGEDVAEVASDGRLAMILGFH